MLHDRKIPGSKANIDPVAIGPGGVFVIETKNYKGEVTIKDDDLFAARQANDDRGADLA